MEYSRNYSDEVRRLTDHELHEQTKGMVAEERKITARILEHLREVERRRLYAAMGFSSLFEYATRSLGYAEASAYRRIAAMRLMKEVPEVGKAIESGRLTLTVASQAQTFFRAEPKYDAAEKREVLEKLEGMSRKECDQYLMQISPAAIPRERERVLTETATEIRFVADRQLLSKFERVRGFLAHRQVVESYSGLFGEMADISIKSLDPREKKVHRGRAVGEEPAGATPGKGSILAGAGEAAAAGTAGESAAAGTAGESAAAGTAGESKVPVSRNAPAQSSSRSIPVSLRRQVWVRDGGRCSYVDSKTGVRCASSYGLQIDHIYPYSLGGKTELENLRLLCRGHNQLLAIKSFGQEKMSQYLGG